MKLDQQQMVVVETTKENVIVDSCPGSGKTTALASKVKHLINQQQIEPDRICILTHTNVASDTISAKLQNVMPQEVFSKLKVFTIHAAALLLMHTNRQHTYIMGDTQLL